MKTVYKTTEIHTARDSMRMPFHGMRGFSLIEVCATGIILSIGLLGLASLHFEALKKSNESFFLSMAGVQADDLMERMRSNIDGAMNGYYNTVGKTLNLSNNTNCLGGVANATTGKTSSAQQRNFVNSSCDTQQIATQDLLEWRTNVQNLLPSGSGNICRTSSPGAIGQPLQCNDVGNVYVISVSWVNQKGDAQEYRVSFKP